MVHGRSTKTERPFKAANCRSRTYPPEKQKKSLSSLSNRLPDPAPNTSSPSASRFAQDTPWAAQGHLVAWDQFEVPFTANAAPKRETDNFPAIKLAEIPDHFVISNDAFSIAIDRGIRLNLFVQRGRQELLTAPLEPNYWRAPTDNDRGNGCRGGRAFGRSRL